MRQSSFNAEQVSEMVALYSANESLKNIGVKFGANPQTIRRLISKAGVVVRGRGRPRKSETPVVVSSSLAPVSETVAPEGPATTDVVTEVQSQRVVSF
jgi:hypothetical protein